VTLNLKVKKVFRGNGALILQGYLGVS